MKKMLLLIITMFFTLTMISCKKETIIEETLYEEHTLSLEYQDNFKIIQLADIQAYTVEELNNAFVEGIDQVILEEKPNLIVLTGDNIYLPPRNDVFEALIFQMEKYKIPWAPIFGNHDDEGILSKEEMSDMFMSLDYCLFDKGPDDISGLGNYVINLINGEKIEYSMIMFDNNAITYFDKELGCKDTYTDQTKGYETFIKTITKQNNGIVPSSLYFCHFPLFEYREACEPYLNNPVGDNIISYRPSIPWYNYGMFQKMVDLNSTKAVFCGHDHINCCDIMYQNIRLNYGLKSSKNSFHREDLLGVKRIIITEDELIIDTIKFNDIM